MGRRTSLFLFTLTLMLALGNFEKVFAFSNDENDSLNCSRLETYDAIFTGKILASKRLPGPPPGILEFYTSRLFSAIVYDEVSIEVMKSFVGAKENSQIRVILLSLAEARKPQIVPELNNAYLFYARKKKDSLIVNNADAKILSQSTAELDFLIDLKGKTAGTTISGTVYEEGGIDNYRTSDRNRALAGTEVVLKNETDDKLVYKTKTDAAGNYEFVDVAAGRYIVEPVLPKRKQLVDRTIIGANASGFGCIERSFILENRNQISGRVFDENDAPLADVKIEIFSADEQLKGRSRDDIAREEARTDESGRFFFAGLPAGRYHVAINYLEDPIHLNPYLRTFYPAGKTAAEASVVAIGDSEKIDGIVFRSLRRIMRRTIRAVILLPDGQPAPNATYDLIDIESNEKSLESYPVNEKGEFSYEVYEHRPYQIKAWALIPRENDLLHLKTESEVFILDENTPEFSLVLK